MRYTLVGSLAAVAVGATVTTQSAGLLPGETVGVLVSSPDGLFAGSAQLQTSVDNVTFTNAGTAMTANGVKINVIRLENFIRLNCTARTAGTVEAVIVGAVA